VGLLLLAPLHQLQLDNLVLKLVKLLLGLLLKEKLYNILKLFLEILYIHLLHHLLLYPEFHLLLQLRSYNLLCLNLLDLLHWKHIRFLAL
tara:strand:+ start:346 stop:615 length:270 start_codon:yes stop_codon:yes gene_type:complete